jgi:hypothetical protein
LNPLFSFALDMSPVLSAKKAKISGCHSLYMANQHFAATLIHVEDNAISIKRKKQSQAFRKTGSV